MIILFLFSNYENLEAFEFNITVLRHMIYEVIYLKLLTKKLSNFNGPTFFQLKKEAVEMIKFELKYIFEKKKKELKM